MNKSNVFFTILISCLPLNVLAQFTQNAEKQIVIGQVESLYSEVLQEEREIWIHLPDQIDSTKRYPVIYVLDASNFFYVITGMIKQLTPWKIPEAIIVGITNTDRIRDFTPTNVPFSRGHNTETSGGASHFIDFIKTELQPYLTKKYPTENNQTIIGHSTAGLFVLYAFLHHQESFDNYLAIEPSLWWDSENLVNEAQEIIEKTTPKEKKLYLAVANSIGKELDTLAVRKDKNEITEQIRANLNFHDILIKNKHRLNYTWEYYKNEDHGSVTVLAQYNGLQALFEWFPFPELWRFNTPKKYTIKELINPFYIHYQNLSKQMKREVKPDWQLVNDIGFFMLTGHNLPQKALAYLEMNVEFYPTHSKSYTALGAYYLSQKNKKEAIKCYEKAFKIDKNKEAKAKLAELRIE